MEALDQKDTEERKRDMFKKLKENNKKGFTLVELIVVLVILAILAALLVPALTGYIDKAKKKSVIAETRQCVMAAQTLADEYYGTVAEGTFDSSKISTAEIEELAEVKGKINSVTYQGKPSESDTDAKAIGTVLTLEYTDGQYTCTYNAKATGDQYSVQ